MCTRSNVMAIVIMLYVFLQPKVCKTMRKHAIVGLLCPIDDCKIPQVKKLSLHCKEMKYNVNIPSKGAQWLCGHARGWLINLIVSHVHTKPNGT